MRTDLSARAIHLGDMRVDVHVREHVLKMDYPAADGRNPTSLEALLASLAGCAANTLHLVLCRKLGAKVESLEVEARAQRRVEHRPSSQPSSSCITCAARHLRRQRSSARSASPRISSVP